MKTKLLLPLVLLLTIAFSGFKNGSFGGNKGIIRAYRVTVTAEHGISAMGFVCFYDHAKNQKEDATYYYGTNTLSSASGSFDGYGGTPPNGETIEQQDKGSLESIMDKANLPHPKGVVLKSITVPEAVTAYNGWWLAGQPK